MPLVCGGTPGFQRKRNRYGVPRLCPSGLAAIDESGRRWDGYEKEFERRGVYREQKGSWYRFHFFNTTLFGWVITDQKWVRQFIADPDVQQYAATNGIERDACELQLSRYQAADDYIDAAIKLGTYGKMIGEGGIFTMELLVPTSLEEAVLGWLAAKGLAGLIKGGKLIITRICSKTSKRVPLVGKELAKVEKELLEEVIERESRKVPVKAPSGAGKLVYDAASKRWTSRAGLVYGQGSPQGNRVLHVMEHLTPNPAKKVHSVFNVQKNELIGLIDEAWVKRGAAVPGDPGAFIVPMGRTVGRAGETSVQIVVKPGTSEIITAYPVK